jgi:hypothetical protein
VGSARRSQVVFHHRGHMSRSVKGASPEPVCGDPRDVSGGPFSLRTPIAS